MGDLIQKTSLLEDNIKKLLALHQGQKAKIHSLEAENKQFKVTIQEQQEQIRQLQDGKLAQHIAHNLKTNQPGKDSNEEVELANRKYPLRINEADIEAVHRAAEAINARLREFEEKYQIRDIQDLFAMAALQMAVQYADTQEPHQIIPEHVADRIAHLNGLLEASLASQ